MRKIKKGFTLVELLIVIALLGAIALVVIAAINPIEQANRARDTRFKSDGAQLIAAIDRYFAASQQFPWVTTASYDNEDSFGFATASNADVGICGDSACSTDGELITSLELKTEFRNRDFIKKGAGADETQKIKIGKDAGSSSSVYACYVPMSKTFRDQACNDSKVYTLDTSGGRSAVSTSSCSGAASWDTTWHVCVPE